MEYDTIDKTEYRQQVGPVSINRDSPNHIHLGIHLGREDGCAADLMPEQCREIARALLTISDTKLDPTPLEYQPFPQELARRVETASGLDYTPGRRTGAQHWLAEQCHIHAVTTSRYFKGTAMPVPFIARRISAVLEWPWEDLVASIIECRVGSTIKEINNKYHT